MDREFSVTVEQVKYQIRTSEKCLDVNEVVHDRLHKHFSMEFHYVFSGEETVLLPVENRKVRLLPGQILLIPSEVYHSATTGNGTVERLCFNFSAETAGKGSNKVLELFQNIKEVMAFENDKAVALMKRYRELHYENRSAMDGMQQGVLLFNVVLEILGGLVSGQWLAGQDSTRMLQQRWTIEEYIENHFDDSEGIEGLAQKLYLSQRQTRTLVKRFLGEDYKTIIIRRRMELAEIFLRDPGKSLEEIARLIGYRSYSGFHLCFKKFYGITPSEKREQLMK